MTGLTAGVFHLPPIGWMGVVFSAKGLTEITFPVADEAEAWHRLRRIPEHSAPPRREQIDQLADELQQYFAGKLREFQVTPDVSGHTPFRQQVWEIDRQIPYGQTRTYGWIARQMDRPNAARAVGGALAFNPIPIIIPCHRVVAKDGSLCGYAGGVQLKADLLALERGQPRLFW